jgi:hypothetical protein
MDDQMRDFVEYGTTPSGEDCAQVGSENFTANARKECIMFIKQIRRTFGVEPEGATLSIKSSNHDLGTYYDVVCYFDDNNEVASDYAYRIDNELPEYWDEEAKKELSDVVA